MWNKNNSRHSDDQNKALNRLIEKWILDIGFFSKEFVGESNCRW